MIYAKQNVAQPLNATQPTPQSQAYKYNSYVTQRLCDKLKLRKLINRAREQHTPLTIEYSKTDNWVKVNGVVYNGISRNDLN